MSHIYAVGDSVLATQCLVSEPSAPGDVRIEIPLASQGVIVRAVTFDNTPYYLVDFAVGGVPVRFRVTPDQLVAVGASRHEEKVPTLQHPHRLCKPLHVAGHVLVSMVYGLVVALEPFQVLSFTVLFLAFVYGHQVLYYGSWSWKPEIFRSPPPTEGEELVLNASRVRCAVRSDISFVAALVLFLVYHTAYEFSDGGLPWSLYFAHVVFVAVAGAFKLHSHDRAAYIRPRYDD